MKVEFKDKYLILSEIPVELMKDIRDRMKDYTVCLYSSQVGQMLIYYSNWPIATIISTIVNIKEDYDENMHR